MSQKITVKLRVKQGMKPLMKYSVAGPLVFKSLQIKETRKV